MEFFPNDPKLIRLPPDEVRIRDLQTHLLEDGRKVKVYLEVDPFQKRPNFELTITGPKGISVAEVSIIETMQHKMELTMHLRGELPAGRYTLEAVLFYGNLVEPSRTSQEPGTIERHVVDTSSQVFEIP
jgi:hypothetical protein